MHYLAEPLKQSYHVGNYYTHSAERKLDPGELKSLAEEGHHSMRGSGRAHIQTRISTSLHYIIWKLSLCFGYF